jgi:hypothetical protein
MSPLDNHVFGIAKAKMRSNLVDETDRLEPSLVFECLGFDQAKAGVSMWERNLMLTQEEISRDAVCKILRPSGKNEGKNELEIWNDFFAYCKDAFRMEVLGLDPKFTDQPPKALQSRLDGVYWK